MKLFQLLNGLQFKVMYGELDTDVVSLEDNSKNCINGSLFFAIKGTKVNGESFITEAIKNGAKTIITQNKNIKKREGLTIILVDDVRAVIGFVAKNFYCKDGYKFKIIGITGTNGKTTTSFIIADALIKNKYNVCVVGTSGIFVNNKQLRGEALTTPDPIDLQELFGFLNSINVDFVVMEVSAHALDLEKTNGIVYDYAIFSNLTEDHLDYFKTMENYGNAKLKLFEDNKSVVAIINTDDELSEKIKTMRSKLVITYGKDAEDYIIKKLGNNSFSLTHNNKCKKIITNLTGIYNFYNITSAIIVLLEIGLGFGFIKDYVKSLRIIDGRFNKTNINGCGKVVLDFAHTPDGLEKLLTNIRENMAGKGSLISVFGCGGNRDKNKRHIMGEISGRLADFTIISIDNPRFESAESVMADIEIGVKSVTDKYKIVLPRAEAIRQAVLMSKVGDVIAVSGKGTEPYYEVNGKKQFYREDIVIDCIKNDLER